jgi:tetratricopeptide (TPR) repeat protein
MAPPGSAPDAEPGGQDIERAALYGAAERNATRAAGAHTAMIAPRGSAFRGRAALASLLLVLAGRTASTVLPAAQDTIATARELYTGAAYRDALGVLDRLAATVNTDRERAIIDQYRALCLVGLNQPEKAAAAAEAMVRHDPLYKLAEEDLSPRTRRLFDDARARVVPAIAQDRYERAKDAYQQGRAREALAAFDDVIAFLDASRTADNTSARLADLRVLATGFRDLASAAVQADPASAMPSVAQPHFPSPASRGAPPAEATAPASALPAPADSAAASPDMATPSPVTVTPPETVRQDVPPWPRDVPFPSPAIAIIEVVIGPDGRVLEARLQRPVHAGYDQLLLAAARKWTYRPALRDGEPTPFVKAVRIELSRGR